MPLTFIHAADLHLDSPFSTLTDMPERFMKMLLEAPYQAFKGLVDLALTTKAQFVCLSGDIFDSNELGIKAQLNLLNEVNRLKRAGIKVFMVFGNHDPVGGSSLSVDLPENCFIFPPDSLECIRLESSTGTPCMIAGISYEKKEEKRNLARMFNRIEPQNCFTIGLLHTNVGGKTSHKNYAPCSMEDLKGSPVHYWALGHIHSKSIMSKEDPFIGYPGVIQGRGFRETGEKGCFLVTVHRGRIQCRFAALATVHWIVKECRLSGDEGHDDILNAITKGLSPLLKASGNNHGPWSIVKVRLVGKALLKEVTYKEDFLAELKDAVNDLVSRYDEGVWVDEIRDHTVLPLNLRPLEQGEDLVAEIIKTSRNALEDKRTRAALIEALSPFYRRREISRFLSLPPEHHLPCLLGQARDLLLELLEQDAETGRG